MTPFPILALSEKAIARWPGWSKPEGNGYMWFNAPLEMDGVALAGFVLHGGCLIDSPDEHVTFELIVSSVRRRRIPLGRIDWRSLQGGHSNMRKPKPAGLPSRTASTHHHEFNVNWDEVKAKMIGSNLPFADNIPRDLKDFESVRAYAGEVFKINNINVVEKPEWRYDLF